MKFNLDRFRAFPNQPHIRKGNLNITRHFEFDSEAVFEVISTAINTVDSIEVFLGLVISNEYASGGITKAVEEFRRNDIYSQLELSSITPGFLREVVDLFEPISHAIPEIQQIESGIVLLSDWNDKWLVVAANNNFYSLHWSTSA